MNIEKTIDRDGQQKLYVQVYSIIKGRIENGEWPAGTQIPTEDELCKTYDVSKATVRMAISELARDGYIKKQQGKGTFVTYSMPYLGMAMKTRLTEDMFGEGVRVKREILSRGVREVAEDIKKYLKVEDEIYYILCKRVIEDEPVYIEELFIPPVLFPGIEEDDICHSSFYDLIQEKSIRKISKVIQTIEVSDVNGENITAVLKLSGGFPVLLMHRLFVASDGSPIAYLRLFGTGRKYKIQTEFERIK